MITLANHGLAQAEIVIPAAASETNRFAAQELARYLGAISGAAFSVHQDDYSFYSCADRLEVCVGPVNREGVPDISGLKNDGYIPVSYTHLGGPAEAGGAAAGLGGPGGPHPGRVSGGYRGAACVCKE